jgi:hypothetical protein
MSGDASSPNLEPSDPPPVASITSVTSPRCYNMTELPNASSERLNLLFNPPDPPTPLSIHLSHGLALTVGSALGSSPPSTDACLIAFLIPNKAGLTAGARAWSKHFHRSRPSPPHEKSSAVSGPGWWGTPSGPVAVINANALTLFWRIMNSATWRNLHWLPHQILVYEARVEEGYGMRWSQDRGGNDGSLGGVDRDWTFRGFVEPMMEGGHEVGWRH